MLSERKRKRKRKRKKEKKKERKKEKKRRDEKREAEQFNHYQQCIWLSSSAILFPKYPFERKEKKNLSVRVSVAMVTNYRLL